MAMIHLSPKGSAIVDAEDFKALSAYKWYARRSHRITYAIRKKTSHGRRVTIFMHRQIMQCPPYLECHHVNHNSLDNRKANLMNLTSSEHKIQHRIDAISLINR